jgi:hypothetical protein
MEKTLYCSSQRVGEGTEGSVDDGPAGTEPKIRLLESGRVHRWRYAAEYAYQRHPRAGGRPASDDIGCEILKGGGSECRKDDEESYGDAQPTLLEVSQGVEFILPLGGAGWEGKMMLIL